MDQKTKEIVERLRAHREVTQFDAAGRFKTYDACASPLELEAASLIESLSERVGELETEKAAIETALDEAGLIAVWLGKDKVQIVCKPGRFEHARHALGLNSSPPGAVKPESRPQK